MPLFSTCGPFTDVAADAFCPFVLEIFTLGITTGTTATTYDPSSNVSRLQMAAFLSRTVDGVLKRGSRSAAMRRFWAGVATDAMQMTTLDTDQPRFVEFDGADLWVSGSSSKNVISRVRASDGALLGTFTGDLSEGQLTRAMGRILFVARGSSPGTGKLLQLDPAQPALAATTVASSLPANCRGLAFDGGRLWTTNNDGTVSIVTPASTLPWTVTTTAGGYINAFGVLYDGGNVWITDPGTSPGALLKLNAAGGVLQTVTVGQTPENPLFDGANIWVPNAGSSTITVVRASNGAVLATLTGNGLDSPIAGAFDGQRVLITNFFGGGLSLWKAADLAPLGSFALPLSGFLGLPASDGASFWIPYFEGSGTNARLVRF